ncbi:hypothetical protein Dimus_008252 [Dionaea muscipula]
MEENSEDSTFDGFKPTMGSKRCSEEILCQMDKKRGRTRSLGDQNSTSERWLMLPSTNFLKVEHNKVDNGKLLHPQMCNFVPKPAPIKFHTAGGRSLSVSGEALQRARNLLSDPEVCNFFGGMDEYDSVIASYKDDKSFDKENLQMFSVAHNESKETEYSPKRSTSSLSTFSNTRQSITNSSCKNSGSNTIQKINSEGNVSDINSQTPWVQKGYNNISSVLSIMTRDSIAKKWTAEIDHLKGSVRAPLVDVTNITGSDCIQTNKGISDVRQPRVRKSSLPFKRPRSSKFVAPVIPSASKCLLNQSTKAPCHRRRVSTRYPIHVSRPYMKDFFKALPSCWSRLEHLSEQVRQMNPDNAENYVFSGERESDYCEIEVFTNMLLQSGASVHHASKKWVTNHYKWIVWKLACYERCSSVQFHGKFLTVLNVLEELKYRYEREANHGHRSAVKRILEGDMPPSSFLVLCISAVRSGCYPEIEDQSRGANNDRRGNAAQIELTDGWYSIDAQLDVLLSQYLASGKLFVGQKLRIWGAGLFGWSGPVSPLEASTVNLMLHANGTYRACWADRLGLCRGLCVPLAFRCIKGNGGPVPRTLVGVTRIYPILYRERLGAGSYVVRSEKLEAKLLQLHDQRCSDIIEGITLDFQRDIGASFGGHDHDIDDGAKIMKMLDGAAEPEVIMAEMSFEQLASLTTYQAKMEETKQLVLQKSIEKALNASGLKGRVVTPFMRIRVVGLVKKGEPKGGGPEEGLITIWNPTEKQRLDLAEGQAYAISGLVPLRQNSNLLYLQARGSTTRWQPLTLLERDAFMPFFMPRQSILLSRLTEVPVSREFDTVGLILHVGEVSIAAHQKRQWVFVTDGSISEMQSGDSTNSLLAISLCAPCVEGDSDSPVNYNLVGCIVSAFCVFI